MIDNPIEFESNDDPETEYIIHPIDEHSLIYGLYSQMRALGTHFSNMQNKYRTLASTWLLAAFIGIGFLLSRSHLDLPINTLLVIVILCFSAIVGILLLWHLDIILYYRFWLAVTVESAKLERHYSYLPRTNLHILEMNNTKKKYLFQSLFYIGCSILLFLIIAIAFYFYFYKNNIPLILSVSSTFIVAFAFVYLMITKGGELEKTSVTSFS